MFLVLKGTETITSSFGLCNPKTCARVCRHNVSYVHEPLLKLLQQSSQHSIEYNLPFAMRFQGDLDIELLKKCFIRIIDRHESLRTTFMIEKDSPRLADWIQGSIK